ncbi:hypothetical protein TIFTF001_034931 [Ficus carica]|uniref:Uncharacterized protein n=1 Tax=Ficus carica TaxID=3494 RepID=A0AA88E0T6_FICCA|nr:hypothetical protein TIFTF001_034931 [Ficus carica]
MTNFGIEISHRKRRATLFWRQQCSRKAKRFHHQQRSRKAKWCHHRRGPYPWKRQQHNRKAKVVPSPPWSLSLAEVCDNAVTAFLVVRASSDESYYHKLLRFLAPAAM